VFSIQIPYNHRRATLEGDTLGVSAPFGTRFSNFFYLTVDRDGNGIAEIGSGSNEVAMLDRQKMYNEQRYFETPTFRLGDAWWQIADLDPAGTELMLRPAEAESEQVAVREGAPAPNWEATTLSGTALSRDALEGKYVLLDFWGSWCAPCITALPKLADVYERFDRERFEIVGFAYESEASLRQTMDDYDINWPQVLDTDGAYSAQFAVRGYPTYYLVGPDGTVVATGGDLRGDNLVDTLESFLE
jgi:thiol-disulfide isomerase/thioredoxin